MLVTTLIVASFLLGANAHSTPKTAEQVKAYHDLQQAAYHCAPAVAAYTAERQRSFAQKVLGGAGGSLVEGDLFEDGKFEDESSSKRKLLACNPVDETTIRNHTCVLAPEVTQGPYYATEGHPIRSNMAEYEPGLLFLMNIGVIDVETCEPVPAILIDLWHANATGHYAGHPEPAPELVNEVPPTEGKRRGMLSPYPKTIPGQTFLRGALPTDKNGVAQFTSIFPGYYTGRATHVHVKVHPEWTPLPSNKGFTSSRLVHTGQLFIEDKLNEAVDKLWPYNTNPVASTRGRTRNWDDGLGVFQDSQEGGYQSTFETHFLGGVLQQGIIGYITMTVNTSAAYDDTWALSYT